MRGQEYIDALAGTVALPDHMDCSLIQFARRLKVYIDREMRKISPDMALVALLCDSARLGWEQIDWAYKEINAPSQSTKPGVGNEIKLSVCLPDPAKCQECHEPNKFLCKRR